MISRTPIVMKKLRFESYLASACTLAIENSSMSYYAYPCSTKELSSSGDTKFHTLLNNS